MPEYYYAPILSIRPKRGQKLFNANTFKGNCPKAERRRFRRLLAASVCLLSTFAQTTESLAQALDGEGLTFERAFEIAVEKSPQTQLLEAQLEAAEGQIEQASLKPNPIIGAELENVLGTGGLEGVDGAELTVGISQLIERREKRHGRAELAAKSKDLFRWNYEEALVALRYQVRQAFTKALVAQQNVALQRELLGISQASEAEVERRAEAAKASFIELSQARLATRRQGFEISRAERELGEAKTQLATLFNQPDAESFELIGSLQLDPEMPSFTELRDLLDQSPALARFQSERQAQEAAIELEQVETKGDVELFGGVKYVREGGDEAAFVLGIDIPWQTRNRNQGNIRSALAGLKVVESQRQIAYREAVADLAIHYRELNSAYDEWQGLGSRLLPSTEATLEATQSGYEQGIATLLSVLEARKALFEIRAEMLEATRRYLVAQSEIERLTMASSEENL